MASFIEFLTDLGFGEIIENEFSIEDSNDYDIEHYGNIYRKNIMMMKDEFDDYFIVEVFLYYNTVLMRSDFCEMLNSVKMQMDTDMWSTLIVYEFNETGESSVFSLMDNLTVGYFDANLENICKKVRAVWIEDYGDSEL